MDELRIFALGRVSIERGGQPVVGLTAAKAKALLVHLAVTALPHSRQALASLLWPDVLESSARSSLRSLLSHMNNVIGEYIVANRQFVALNRDLPIWVDATHFEDICRDFHVASLPLPNRKREQLRAAVNLYQGDFLDDFHIIDASSFEEWQLREREGFRQLALSALEWLTADAIERSAFNEGIEDARQMLQLDSAHELAHRHLMTLLVRNGQRSAALSQFESCRHILEVELGVEPDATTLALADQIRAGVLIDSKTLVPLAIGVRSSSDLLAYHIAAGNTPGFLDPDAPTPPSKEPFFVARKPQLAQMMTSLDATYKGYGQVVFVTGQAGTGKSFLLREFVQQAQARYPNLIWGRGMCNFYTGVGEPYLPFREIMSMISGDVEGLWASGAISQEYALRLWRLVPEAATILMRQGPGLVDTFVSGARLADRISVHGTIEPKVQSWLLEAIANRRGLAIEQEQLFQEYSLVIQKLSTSYPILLFLDDLQWADASSISMLFHMARRVANHRILLIVAYRPEDTEGSKHDEATPLKELLDELRHQFGNSLINLDKLGADEERDFVDALVDAEPNLLSGSFRQSLFHQSHGHALFTIELLHDLQERGVLRQSAQGYWVQEGEITWATLPARVESIIEKRLRRLDPELREALTIASIEGEEFTAEVVARIQEINALVVVRRLGRLNRQPTLVTAQRVVYMGSQRMSKYRFGHNLFQRYLYSSLDNIQRVYLHEAVAVELERLYADQTEQIAIQLAQHFEIAGIVLKAIHYWRQAGESATKIYANREAITAFSRALTLVKEALTSRSQSTTKELFHHHLGDLYAQVGRTLEIDSQYDRALLVYREMAEIGRALHDRTLELAALMAQASLFVTYNPKRDLAHGEDILDEALKLARDSGNESAEARILWILITVYSYTGRMPQAIVSGERSLELARKLNLREQIAYTLSDLGIHVYVQQINFDKARSVLRESLAIWQELSNQPMYTNDLSTLCVIAVYSAEHNEAIALSEQAFQHSQSIGSLWGQSYSRMKIGCVYWELGQIDKALRIMNEAIQVSEACGFTAPQGVTRVDLARLLAELGAVDSGLQLAKSALTAAETNSMPLCSAALGTMAYLYALRGEFAEAERVLLQGKHERMRQSHPVWNAPLALAEAILALRQGDYTRAQLATTDLIQLGERSFVPQALYLQSQALLGKGQTEAAHNCLAEAYRIAQELGMRGSLWRICAALGELTVDPGERQAFYAQSHEVLLAIVETIPPLLRTSFLELPEVRAMLST